MKRKLEGGEEREVKKESAAAVKEEPRVKTEGGTSVKTENAGDIVCPYLDTIERSRLEFDFDKLCRCVERNAHKT
jgi:hypothetical protein